MGDALRNCIKVALLGSVMVRQAPPALMTVPIATTVSVQASGRLRVMQPNLIVPSDARLVINKLMLRPLRFDTVTTRLSHWLAFADGLRARHEVAVPADALACRVVLERQTDHAPPRLRARHRQYLTK